MKKKAISEERKVRKLILTAETLRTLTTPDFEQVAGASIFCGGGGTTACTGSADCCQYH